MKYIVYDFDNTIYDGDSTFDFLKFSFINCPYLIFKLPKIFISLLKYKLKKITKTQAKEELFSVVQKIKDIDTIVNKFWIKNDNKIKKFYKVKNHDNDIIISAGPKFLLEPIAKKYKVHDLIASKISKKTGKFSGKNCYGIEKVKAFKKKYPTAIIEEMYTDSQSDFPLMQLSKKGFIVVKNEIYNYTEYLKINKLKKVLKFIDSYYKSKRELLNYLIFGILTFFIGLITYYILTLTTFNESNAFELQIANIISWIVSVLFAYVTNRKFVFQSKNEKVLEEMISFCGSRLITLIIDMVIMFIFVTILKINSKFVKFVSQFVVIVTNYILSKLIIFKSSN